MGRLLVCRLYEMTTDSGVRDMLSFLIARDTMHQNQWIAAIKDIEAEGIDGTPCPMNFPQDMGLTKVSYQYMNCSPDGQSKQGSWAKGPTPDGKGQFQYVDRPTPLGEIPQPGQVDPRFWGTPADPSMAKMGAAAVKSGAS